MLKFFKLGSRQAKKPNSVLVVDAGASCFRLMLAQRKGDRLVVSAMGRHPLSDEARENRGEDQVANALKDLVSDAGGRQKQVCLTAHCPSERVWYVETPMMGIGELRNAIRLGATAYLKQDCSDVYLDCAPLARVKGQAGGSVVDLEEKARPTETDDKADKGGDGKVTKMKVLVAGAGKSDVRFFIGAAAKAGMEVPAFSLNLTAAVNAFEFSMGKAYQNEVLAVLDVGFRGTALNLIHQGKPVLTRLIEWGGDNITQYISQMLSVEWRTAEEEKLKMSEPVQHLVRDSMSELVRHVRSSLDFFENEYGLVPSRVGVAGGSAQSDWIIKCLGEMLGMPCESWKRGEAIVAVKGGDGLETLNADFACVTGTAISLMF